MAGAGLAGAALVGCGSGDDDAPGTGGTPSGGGAGGTTSPGTGAAEGEPRQGGTLRLASGGEPRSLDPHFDTFPYNTWITNATHNNLVRFSRDLTELIPDTADLPEQPDDLTYVFHLQPGIHYQDIDPVNGRELVAEDVKYSIERQSNQHGDETGTYQHAYYFKDRIASIDTPDEHTVVFTTTAPYAPFMSYMASPWTPMIAREVVEADGDLTQRSIGTGPFILNEWRREVRFTLERNPNYFKEGKPYVDRLEYIVSTDPDTSATQFSNRDFDAYIAGQTQLDRVRQARGADTSYEATPSQFWRQFRMSPTDENHSYEDYAGTDDDSAKAFADIRVREAICRAIDKQEVLDLAHSGDGLLTYGPILPQFELWALKEELVPHDLTEAASLMQAAGVSELRGPMMWATSAVADQIGEIIKQQLEQINVITDLQPMELAAYYNKTYAYRYMFSHHVPLNSPDPDENLSSYFGERSTYFKHYNPEVFELVKRQAETVDQEERRAIVEEAQRKIVLDYPIHFMFTTNQHRFISNALKGFQFSLDLYDGFAVEDAWLEA